MNNINTIVRQIETQSDSHTSDLRFIRDIQINEVIRQGDVYIQRVDNDYPKGDIIENWQLAPGTSKGSRHIVEAGDHVTIHTLESNDILHGPVIVARERWTVTHPEHADCSIPSGTYRVGYQLDLRTRKRVVD
jgi:hypothetical protein